jgi:hypothetical protein
LKESVVSAFLQPNSCSGKDKTLFWLRLSSLKLNLVGK